MSKQTKIWAGIGTAVALLVMGATLFYWVGGRSTRKVIALQKQLLESSDLSRTDRNALKAQLMRTVDEMDRGKLRDMQGKLREQQRAEMQASMDAYLAASEEEKQVVLDATIDRLSQAREVYAALRTDGMRGRRSRGGNADQRSRDQQNGRGDRNRQNRPPDDNRAAGSPSDQNRQRPSRGPGTESRQRGDRPELSEEQRQLRNDYFAALAARAQERGIEVPLGRRRGNRSGPAAAPRR